MKNKQYNFIIILILIITSYALSADYTGFQHEFFLEQHPSAKANGMGHGLTALTDGAFTSYYNPAGIIANAGFCAAYAEISPYYFIDDAKYAFGGLTHEWGTWGTVGLSQYRFSAKGGIAMPTGDASSRASSMNLTLTTLTLSKNFLSDIALGVNFNLYYYNDFFDLDHFSFPLDVGLLKSFLIESSNTPQKFTLGMVVKNAFAAKTDAASDDGDAILPMVFRAGAGWEAILMDQEAISGLLLLGLELNAEYENVLNANNYSGYKIGSQVSLLEMLYFRLGYYAYNFPDWGGKDSSNALTWGIGARIFLDAFVQRHFPLYVGLDYAKLSPPTYKTGLDDKTNSTLSLQIQWTY